MSGYSKKNHGRTISLREQERLQKRLKIFCPICIKPVLTSLYLHKALGKDRFAETAANLVTHYRHEHIKYYHSTRFSPRASNPKYTKFRNAVNNRAKRQIIRALMKRKAINYQRIIVAFRRLNDNDKKTILLITKCKNAIDRN